MNAENNSASLLGVHVVLVVEEAERLTLFKQALEHWGALVSAGSSADWVERVLNRLQADALVIDVDGAQRDALIAAARSVPLCCNGSVPALALSASRDDRQLLLAAGFREHLTKPVHAAHLCRAVGDLVDKRFEL